MTGEANLIETVAASIRRHRLLRSRQAVLVAVSGGLDSMVLLNALATLSDKNHWAITVAHYDHRLRGPQSRRDQAFVKKEAARLKLPFVGGSDDVEAHLQNSRESLEMGARRLRHAFLAKTARSLQIRTVALAHHADDQVELLFLRLFRGSGDAGLAGMTWKSTSPADRTIQLIRPLLDCSRGDLKAFADVQHIPYREDPSNSDRAILRNRVRHELIPLLERHYQPALKATVLRTMELSRANHEAIETMASEWLRRVEKAPPFGQLPRALQREVLRQQLLAAAMTPTFELIERLRHKAGERFTVNSGATVERLSAGEITVRPLESSSTTPDEQLALSIREKGGSAVFGGLKLDWRVCGAKAAWKELKARMPFSEVFDAEKVGPTVLLRHWQPGDRFQPSGMRRPAKLQNLFVNAKINRLHRHELVVACTRTGEVFWVEGLRIGQRFKLDKRTRHGLKWSFARSERIS